MLILLYTFDSTEGTVDSNMLECSILSVLKRIGDKVKIIIYSIYPEKLEFLNKKYNVEIFKYIPEDYGHEAVGYSDFQPIGHSRIFLIPMLLERYKLPLLYLDNDTGLLPNFDLDQLLSLNIVSGYVTENLSNFDLLMIKFYDGEYTTSDRNLIKSQFPKIVINNGTQYFPYNENGIQTCINIKNDFFYYKNLFDTKFNDMVAFSSVVNEGRLNKMGILHYFSTKRIHLEKINSYCLSILEGKEIEKVGIQIERLF